MLLPLHLRYNLKRAVEVKNTISVNVTIIMHIAQQIKEEKGENMPLSEEEERQMYTDTLKCAWTLDRVEAQLQKGNEKLDDHESRLISLEGDQKLLSGKLGFIVLGMSVCFTAALHAIGWLVSHFGGKS